MKWRLASAKLTSGLYGRTVVRSSSSVSLPRSEKSSARDSTFSSSRTLPDVRAARDFTHSRQRMTARERCAYHRRDRPSASGASFDGLSAIEPPCTRGSAARGCSNALTLLSPELGFAHVRTEPNVGRPGGVDERPPREDGGFAAAFNALGVVGRSTRESETERKPS